MRDFEDCVGFNGKGQRKVSFGYWKWRSCEECYICIVDMVLVERDLYCEQV